MNNKFRRLAATSLSLFALGALLALPALAQNPIHVTHLWHMHQPIYYPYLTPGTIDSQGLFNFSVQGVWDGDRYSCYRDWPAGAVSRASGRGASQMSYSGSLAENNRSLWGDYSGWAGNVRNARNNLKTTGGNSRLDVVGIAYHHSLMPLTCKESMVMQIRLHKEQYKEVWNTGGAYSKGFWPPECAFDSSMVPALVEEGLDWVIVDNGHFFRTIEDFEWSSASSCRPNKADVRNGTSTDPAINSTWVTLPNVWAPTKVLAPWSYQPRYTRYVNPWNGNVQKIIAVPAGRYEGNENGRGGYGAFKPENVWGSNLAANSDPNKPMLLLCHSDGDNYGMKNSDAWNGQHQLFVDMCNANAGFEYTGVQDYLGMYPPNPNDVIHIEPGTWIGIDGGTPYYDKWMSYENRDGEMPDMWSWSVLVAAQNRVLTADDMENSYLSGTRDVNDIEWGLGNDTARAWRYYLQAETSCHWYWDYDRANPWDGNVTRGCNLAIAEANKVIGRNPNGDNRGPSIFPPQRLPYNPGGKMWNESSNAPSDFVVWTFVDDASGVQSVKLYWRKDNDGQWPLSSTENETYAGGPGVGAWQTVNMTGDWWPTVKGPNVPTESNRAMRYQGTIAGQSESLIDYFVEAVDTRGKTNRSNILHVWVGEQTGGTGGGGITPPAIWARGTHSWPAAGEVTSNDVIYINTDAGPATDLSRVTLAYRINSGTWNSTNMTVNPDWASAGGQWHNRGIGPFPADSSIEYYIEVVGGSETNWDNNGGANYTLTITAPTPPSSLWIGNTAQKPANGEISSTNQIVISCETWPIGAATNVGLVFSADGGSTWQSANLVKTGETNNNDVWSVAIGPFADGTAIRYALNATLAGGAMWWDNNSGNDFNSLVGSAGVLRMVAGTPDMASEAFDLVLTGGAAATSGDAGFGDFGRIYINFDATNLYLGGTDVSLPTDVDNNAYVIFVSGGNEPGASEFWYINSAPDGLDRLHNIGFNPPLRLAILLGDIYGDASHTNFGMYHGEGPDFGQGVFNTPNASSENPQTFTGVDGAQLIQFAPYGYNNQQAASWKCAIPLNVFGVTNASALTNLHLSGVMVSINTNNGDNSYLSGKYVGTSLNFPNPEEQPDQYGNIGTSYVYLAGLPVLPPATATETLGVPNNWISGKLPPGHAFTENSDYDGDGIPDRLEYFADLDPTNFNSTLMIEDMTGTRVQMRKAGGQLVNYAVETADALISNNWNWTTRSTIPSTDGELTLPNFTASNLLMRIKVVAP